MSTQNLHGVTQSMTASTVGDAGHRHHEPSPRALAARSWNVVRRLDGDERAAATAEHFERFVPNLGSSCRF